MGRPKGPEMVRLHVSLPRDLNDRVVNHLSSEIEGRVPWGVLSGFFISLVEAHFAEIDKQKQPKGTV